MAAENQDRYAVAERILERLAPELAAEGFDLVDVRIFQGGGRLQVRLYVDLIGGGRIDLDACAEASRSASMILEAADIFAGPWVLEVSSPGIRRPLRRPEHFLAAVGEAVQVKWRSSAGRPQQLRGKLLEMAGGTLRIEPAARTAPVEEDPAGEEAIEVPLADVLEGNLDRDFDVQEVIRRDRRRRKEEKKAGRGTRRRRATAGSRLSGRAADGEGPPQAEAPEGRDEKDGK